MRWTDTDDDNIPAASIPYEIETNMEGYVCADVVNRSAIAWNGYRHFGVHHLHNRGLPLRHVRPGQELEYEESQYVRPLIQQGVVHCDPDLDAIQRLTLSPALTSDVRFSETSTFLAFPPMSYHPINSQNTIFLRDALWALLLPVTTLWREDDIFRGYWSQRLLWEIGGSIVLTGPTAYQLRNPHDFSLDYRMEHNMYLKAEDLLEELNEWTCPPEDELSGEWNAWMRRFCKAESRGRAGRCRQRPLVDSNSDTIPSSFCQDCITRAMSDLRASGFIGMHDVMLAETWVADLKSIGYKFPARQLTRMRDNSQGMRPCGQAEKLPKSFTDTVVRYSKEELKAVFEPVACVAWAQESCVPSG